MAFSDVVSPMITVETCGEKKYSAAKDGVACGSTAASHWKEHLFFEPRGIVSEIIVRANFVLMDGPF